MSFLDAVREGVRRAQEAEARNERARELGVAQDVSRVPVTTAASAGGASLMDVRLNRAKKGAR